MLARGVSIPVSGSTELFTVKRTWNHAPSVQEGRPLKRVTKKWVGCLQISSTAPASRLLTWEKRYANFLFTSHLHFLLLQLNIYLFKQLQRLESGALDLSPFISVRLAQQLFRATNHSSKLYGSDVLIGRELLLKILEHDTAREGFNLTHRHDKDFIKVYYILKYF